VDSAGSDDNGDADLDHLRTVVADLSRRPAPPDADALREIITASITDAMSSQPNLLVTAIRRLDRLDGRLESIETALGQQLARQSAGSPDSGRAAQDPSGPSPMRPARRRRAAADAEVIADALAHRLTNLTSSLPNGDRAGGATLDDVLGALARIEGRIDIVANAFAPATGVDLATTVADLEDRLDRSIGQVLASASQAEHICEQSALWSAGSDGLAVDHSQGPGPPSPPRGHQAARGSSRIPSAQGWQPARRHRHGRYAQDRR